MNNKIITHGLVLEWQETQRKASQLEDQIQKRITYILQVWFKAFGSKLETWYFNDAGEGEVGDLYRHFGDDSIHGFYVECKPRPKGNDEYESMVIFNKDGYEYGWESEIPTRWLYEDFESEIIEGKKKYDEQLRLKKEKAAAKRAKHTAETNKLADEALSKLSKTEIAALKKVL